MIPCLNAGRYIEEAIRSILLQAYPDLEIIVMDGGSDDGTIEILENYSLWIAYSESVKDSGQSHAINKGLNRATGILFNWFNADDVMPPGALLALAGARLQHPNAVGVCGAMDVFSDTGVLRKWMPVSGTKEDLGNWGAPAFLPQPAALFDCALCKKIEGVNERLHYVMDVELMLRLADYGSFVTITQVTSRFRDHEGSKTMSDRMSGLVELIASEFNLGLAKTAEKMLQRRMDGHAALALDNIGDQRLKEFVDRWSYQSVVIYLARRLLKSIVIRAKRFFSRFDGEKTISGPSNA